MTVQKLFRRGAVDGCRSSRYNVMTSLVRRASVAFGLVVALVISPLAAACCASACEAARTGLKSASGPACHHETTPSTTSVAPAASHQCGDSDELPGHLERLGIGRRCAGVRRPRRLPGIVDVAASRCDIVRDRRIVGSDRLDIVLFPHSPSAVRPSLLLAAVPERESEGPCARRRFFAGWSACSASAYQVSWRCLPGLRQHRGRRAARARGAGSAGGPGADSPTRHAQHVSRRRRDGWTPRRIRNRLAA